MLRAIVLCDSIMLYSNRFLKFAYDNDIKVKKLGGFRYTVNDNMQVELRRAEFPSIAGARADILATDIKDREIEAYRSTVLCHSQFKEGKDIITTKDLMEFIKKNK